MKIYKNSTNTNAKITILNLDLYTKAILTIIASCLILISIHFIFIPNFVNADPAVQDVNIRYINVSSIWGDNIPINMEEIKGRSIWSDEIPVNVKSINGSSISGNVLPVKIK